MTTLRFFGVPDGTTEKELELYFENPVNGGGVIEKIHHPLRRNEAVIRFKQVTDLKKLLSGKHCINGSECSVQQEPDKVFSRVTTQLEPHVTQLLDQDASHLDNLQFLGDVEVTFDPDSMNYMMAGSWYDIEWAQAYLVRICKEKGLKPAVEDNNNFRVTSQDFRERADDTVSISSSNSSNGYVEQSMETAIDPKFFNGNAVEMSDKFHPNLEIQKSFDFKQTLTDTVSKEKHGNLDQYNTKLKPPDDGSFASSRQSDEKVSDAQSYSNIFGRNEIPRPPFGRNNIPTPSENELEPDMPPLRPYYPHNRLLFRHRRENLIPDEFRDRDEFHRRSAPYLDYDSDDEFEPYLYQRRHPSRDPEALTPMYRSRLHGYDLPPVPMPPQLAASISKSDFEDTPLTLEFNVGPLDVRIKMGDLLQEKTDAIVSPASTDLSNTYGVAAVISLAAGSEMVKECQDYIQKHGSLCIGDVIHTRAGGKLDNHVAFILHAVGPHWREDQANQTAHLLTCTYLNCFQHANRHLWSKSISMPLISTGLLGVPLDVCVQSFHDALLLHVYYDKLSRHLEEVTLINNDQDSACATVVILRSLMDVDEAEAQKAAVERYAKGCSEFEFQAKDICIRSEEGDKSVTSEDSKSRGNDDKVLGGAGASCDGPGSSYAESGDEKEKVLIPEQSHSGLLDIDKIIYKKRSGSSPSEIHWSISEYMTGGTEIPRIEKRTLLQKPCVDDAATTLTDIPAQRVREVNRESPRSHLQMPPPRASVGTPGEKTRDPFSGETDESDDDEFDDALSSIAKDF